MIQRLGVYEKWEKGLKSHINYLLKKERNYPVDYKIPIDELSEFCIAGELSQYPYSERPVVHPVFERWEDSSVITDLYALSATFERKQELTCLTEGNYVANYLGNIFGYTYIAGLISIYAQNYFPKRFGRAGGLPLSMQIVPYSSIGILLGVQPQTFNLSRLLIRAFHNKWFIYQEYPIFCFMLRILADYLDEPPIELTGNAAKEMLFHELFDKWRSSDPQAISKLCLAACDYHTHQCKPDSGNKWHEFNSGEWVRWPIEINLLFKLRQLLGLENPELDHPLMNSRLGQLPEEQPFEFDELLVRVITRMKQQGFDEKAVFERIYYEKI